MKKRLMKRTNEKTKEGEEAKEGLQKELKEERDEKLWRKGLESAEAEKRLKKYGENRIFVLREPSFFDFISTMLDQFHLPTILFLFSIILFSYIDLRSSIIAFVLILGIGIINAFRDFNVKKSIAKLSEPYPGYTTVIRDGLRKRIPATEIVPGDIILLRTGMRIPGDGVILKGRCIVDESQLSGLEKDEKEKFPITEEKRKEIKAFNKKNPSEIFAGSYIINVEKTKYEIECIVEILSTGKNTKYMRFRGPNIGEGDEKFGVETERRELIKKIDKITTGLSLIMISLAFIIFVFQISYGVPLLVAFTISAAAAVAAIPEYIFSISRLSFFTTLERISKGLRIRREKIVDDLNRVGIICTEKVGTLTINQPTIKRIWLDGRDIDITGDGWETAGVFNNIKDYNSFDRLTELAVIASKSIPIFREGEKNPIMSGDLKEAALTILGMKNRQSIESLRSQYHIIERKYDGKTDATIITVQTPERKYLTIVFGSVDGVVAMCNRFYKEGKFYTLRKKVKTEIEHKNIQMAATGFSTMAIGYLEKERRKMEGKLTLLGLLGLVDPPKPKIKEIIEDARTAKIKIVIITKESETTAIQFARSLGVLTKETRAVICDELRYLKGKERDNAISKITVFARSTPMYEKIIIEGLKKELKNTDKTVVFVESTGTNLEGIKTADSAITLESSPDILKFNSDAILLNDDFYYVPKAIEEARGLEENIKRTFYSLFSIDFSILFFILLSVILFNGKTIGVLQILFVNIIANSLISEGLSKDRVPKSTLVPKTRKFPSSGDFTFAFILSIYLSVIVYFVSSIYVNSEFFSSIVIATLSISFIAVSLAYFTPEHSLIKNITSLTKRFIAIITVVIFITFCLIYLPVVQDLFSFAPLAPHHWIPPIIVGLSIIVISEIKKMIIK